jgi:hypothetical protein
MGNTFFCFSDEFGDYKPNMSEKQINSHPIYLRSTLIINSNEWKQLNNAFLLLKEEYNIPRHVEVKWSNLWSSRQAQLHSKTIQPGSSLWNLKEFDYHHLVQFVNRSVELITKLKFKKIIATVTFNDLIQNHKEEDIIKFHLQDTMQRIEMEIQYDPENLAVLFIDPVSTSKNELYRKAYHELYQEGDFINKYKCIKDSINIENSHQSVGIQIADYISGCIGSILKLKDINRYENAMVIFNNYIHPNLRVSHDDKILGYGIVDITKSDSAKNKILHQLNLVKDL